MEHLIEERIVSSEVVGNQTIAKILRIYKSIRDDKPILIKRLIRRTTIERSNLADSIVPFGKAAISHVKPMIGEEVHFEKPAKKPTIESDPRLDYTEEMISKSLPVKKLDPSLMEKHFLRMAELELELKHILTGTPTTIPIPIPTKTTFADAFSECPDSDKEYQQTLFIDNIPDFYNREDITNLVLASCPMISSRSIKRINIVYDKTNGRSRGQAFVMLDSAKLAECVKDLLHEGRIPGSGCVLSVKIAQPPRN